MPIKEYPSHEELYIKDEDGATLLGLVLRRNLITGCASCVDIEIYSGSTMHKINMLEATVHIDDFINAAKRLERWADERKDT